MRVAIVVVAAGSGTRLGLNTPKAFADLGGRTLFEESVRLAAQARLDSEIVAVVPDAYLDIAEEILAELLGESSGQVPWTVVSGGATRQASVARGLACLSDEVDVVLVHDSARALTPSRVFEDVARAVAESGDGVVASVPVVDTVKSLDSNGIVTADIDRTTLAIMQTPQGFPRSDLDRAYQEASHGDFTDDASTFRAAGLRVRTVPGDAASFKITTPEDLTRARDIFVAANQPDPLDSLGQQAVLGISSDEGEGIRVGTGVDTHAFTDDPSVPLKLAGLDWPGERGLSGHSDGDAVAHAICDALLSAAQLGDIGSVFGTDDPRFANASGDVFVTHAVELLREAGFEPRSVSVQVIGNRPRLSPRRAEAEELLAAWVGAPVSVSATTTDGLGFTGRGEGIAAIAMALVQTRAVSSSLTRGN